MNQLEACVAVIYLCNNIVNNVDSSRILIVPIQRASHMIQINAIGQELQSRGHEVRDVTLDSSLFRRKLTKKANFKLSNIFPVFE